MLSAKAKIVLFLVLIGVVDTVVPLPILTAVLLVVVISRPPWFRSLVDEIYRS